METASLPPLPPRWRLALLALPVLILWGKILATAPLFARLTGR